MIKKLGLLALCVSLLGLCGPPALAGDDGAVADVFRQAFGARVDARNATNGQVLTFNTTTNKWEAAAASGGGGEDLEATMDLGNTVGSNDLEMGAQRVNYGGAGIAAIGTLGQALAAVDGSGNYQALFAGGIHAAEGLNGPELNLDGGGTFVTSLVPQIGNTLDVQDGAGGAGDVTVGDVRIQDGGITSDSTSLSISAFGGAGAAAALTLSAGSATSGTLIAGGNLDINAGDTAGTNPGSDGGNVTVCSGDSTNGDGGDVIVTVGTGGGVDGDVITKSDTGHLIQMRDGTLGGSIAPVSSIGQALQATDGAGGFAAMHQGNTHVYEDLNVYNPTDNTDRLLVTVNASSATIQEFGAAGGMQITSNSSNVLFQCAAAASYGFGLTGGRALRDINNTTWNILTNEFFVASGTDLNWSDDAVASSGASSRDAGISFVNSTTAFLRVTDGGTGHGDLHLAHMVLEGDSGIALVSSQLVTTTNGSQSDGSSSEAAALRYLVEVVESTTAQPAQISQTDTGQLRTNRGATVVVTETLPGSPSVGCTVGFQRVETFAYRIDPEGSEEIHFAGEVSMGAGDYLEITNDFGIVWVRWDGTHWLADLGGDTTVAEQP